MSCHESLSFHVTNQEMGEGGLAKDWALALKWHELAADQGSATSMGNIGLLYFFGGHGIVKNEATAAIWYRKSAEAGSAGGQRNLACRVQKTASCFGSSRAVSLF